MIRKLSRKSLFNLGLSLVVVVVIAILLAKDQSVSSAALMEAVTHFGPTCLAVVFSLAVAQIFCTILRTWLLFPKEAKVGLLGAAHAISFGQLVNTFFPARAGDVLKAVIARDVSRDGSLSLMTGAGVILADKVVDFGGLVLLVLFSGTHLLSRIPQSQIERLEWILPLLVSVGGVICFWLARSRTAWIHELSDGFISLRRPKRIGAALVIATLSWACEAGALRTLCYFQGIALSFDDVVFLLCLLNLAIAVPVSLANLGTFEATLVFGLGTFGVAVAKGLAVATVHHSAQLVGIIAWAGSVALLRRFLVQPPPHSLRSRREAEREARCRGRTTELPQATL